VSEQYISFIFLGFLLSGILFFSIAWKFKILMNHDDKQNDSYDLKFAFYWVFQVNGWLFIYQDICLIVGIRNYDAGAVIFVFVSIIPVLRYLWRS
jgi:hypothetical protein